MKRKINEKAKNSVLLSFIVMAITLCFSFFSTQKAKSDSARGGYRILLNDYSGCWSSGGTCMPTVIVRPKEIDDQEGLVETSN